MKDYIEKKIIGVAGCGDGTGCTHLSIALANYSASKFGKKTAYVELGEKPQMSVLQLEKNAKKKEGYFSYQGVDMFCRVKKEKLPILFHQDYDTFIVDIGGNLENCREAYLRCARKYLLGNYVKWRSREIDTTIHMLRQAEWGFLEPEFFTVFAEEKEKQRLEKKYHIHIRRIPQITNAFRIQKQEFGFLDQMM